MDSIDNNVILAKSKKFAVRIINCYKYLSEVQHEYVLSRQLLKSGTSIGANVRESVNAQSRPDFVSKLSIALKEAGETLYWLELLVETEYIESRSFASLSDDCVEIIKLLTSIVKTTKAT